jgi:5-formyltetrahydrofolate cyclo-ligase
MLKDEARKLFLSKRISITSEAYNHINNKILEEIESLKPQLEGKNIHIFLSISDKAEIKTSRIIELLRSWNCSIYTSISNFDKSTMDTIELKTDTIIKENKYGIPEPVSSQFTSSSILDIIFIPLLAYDQSGYRVGYGKGFYDRYLANCNKDLFKIGLSPFEPIKSISNIDQFDVPLDICISPDQTFRFD